MRSRFEYDIYERNRRLADLQQHTAELERRLFDAEAALHGELVQPALEFDEMADEIPGPGGGSLPGMAAWQDEDIVPGPRAAPAPADVPAPESPPGAPGSAERREMLVKRGRSNAYTPGMSRGRKLTVAAAAGAMLITILGLALSRGGPSWPPSVATVQAEAARACQNPDVKSEPDQVNFACAKATTQILWVFALMTSGDNPDFGDAQTGRLGLEPITPQQGGEVAWSLNLHGPYDPSNPIDSLEVAARAINDIIGGATLTAANGKPEVEPGLESYPANCLRYTGSAAVRTRTGFPSLCALPVSTPAGQAALVADVYQKWVVGAAPQAAQDAAVLYENAGNPGAPQVQAILRHLPGAQQPAQS